MVDAIIARALKKNPNERFPTAEAMRDECLRVAQSLQSAAPSIVPGAQTASGAGVGAAVFPPVDSSMPQSGSVQTPYQSGPYGPPTPAPGPVTPGYGYPQQGGYQTPAPVNAYAPQSAQTPPPYTLSPQQPTQTSAQGGGSGGGKRNMPVIVGSIVVALLAIGGLITAMSMGGDDDKGAKGKESKAPVAGHRGPDRSKTIETEECTEPDTAYNDETKIKVPDFTFRDWRSVQKCLQAAGWQFDKRTVDENTYGQDTVMMQSPKEGSDIDPKDVNIEFTISTGNPA